MWFRSLVLCARAGFISSVFIGLGIFIAQPLAVNRANLVVVHNLVVSNLGSDGCAFRMKPQALDLSRLSQARSEWQRVVAIWPNAFGRFRQEALLSLMAGDWDEARLNLDRANDPISRLRSAWLAAAQGRFMDSAHSLAVDYENPLSILLQRGYRLYESKQYADALVCFEVAVPLDSTGTEALIGRGRMYQMLGQNQLAMADFDRAVERCPGCYQPYLYRGYSRYALGMETQAEDDFYRAVTLAPEEYGTVLQWGYWLHTTGRLTDAEAQYMKAIYLGPNYLEPILALAELYCQSSQPGKAKSLLEAAQTRFTSSADIDQIRLRLSKCK